jgi:excinuclease ABC subunit B
MQRAIDETNRRRAIQEAYNTEHGITPKSIIKAIRESLREAHADEKEARKDYTDIPQKELMKMIRDKEKAMLAKAKNMEFEEAASLRDEIKDLRATLLEMG